MTYHRQNLPSSMAKKLHYKLARVVSRHDHLKISFKHLKTQIEIGLLEAEDVFSSLAVPLMTLVGLKSGDMAKQGRSTTFFITTGSNSYRDKSEDMTADVDMMSNGERECEVHKLEEYTNKVIMAGQELIDKQKMQLMQQMRLLKQVEGSVNSSQNSMIQNIDNHKDSLRTFLQKAVTYVSTIQHSSHDEHAFNITLKLLKAIYDHVCEILSSVEGGVDNLINRLAEQMCQPMMEYVKSLKAEMTTGTCPRLLGKLEDMKKVTRDGRVELEQARKKVRLAEERKLEALSRLKESEENLKKMRQYMGLSTNYKNESTGHYSKNKDKSEDMTADVDMMSNGERECEVHKLEEEYTNKVIMAGQELIDKQKMQLMQLMRLLKQVEGSVNSSQNSMNQTIDNHKDGLRTFLQKAVTYVSTIQHSSHDKHAFNITLKLLKAIYDHVCEILSSVEGGVDNLINRLAEQMCRPMMEYVKSLKAEMTTGTCPRLLGKLEDMKKVTRDGRVELEQARKKVRLAEKRKLEALSRLKESEENLKKMRQYMGLSTNDKNESTGHYSKNKLLAPVEDQAKEDKLLWDLLKKKQTSQQPQSPFGPKALIPVATGTKHYKPTLGQPSITRIPTTRVYGKQNPQPLNLLLQLGSSPSVTAYQV